MLHYGNGNCILGGKHVGGPLRSAKQLASSLSADISLAKRHAQDTLIERKVSYKIRKDCESGEQAAVHRRLPDAFALSIIVDRLLLVC